MKEQLRATLYIEIKLQCGPTREGRGCLRVGAVSSFFFFFRFTTRANSRQCGADAGQCELADSGRIGPYRAKPPIQAEIQQKKGCETHRLTSHVSRLILSDSFSSHVSAQFLLLSSLCAPPAPLHRLITDKFCF